MRNAPLALAAATATLFLAAAGAAVRAAPAAAPDAAVELARLQAWLDGTRDLSGSFEQELLSGALGAGVPEAGRFRLLRPGKLRFDYVRPERKVAIVDGDRTRLWIEEDAQLLLGRLEDAGDLLPTLLAGDRPLSAVFEATAPPAGETAATLRLTPRGEEQGFRHVDLRLDPETGALLEADVQDAAGNRLRYRFFDLERNRGLRAAAFEFEPPPGTEILGEAAP